MSNIWLGNIRSLLEQYVCNRRSCNALVGSTRSTSSNSHIPLCGKHIAVQLVRVRAIKVLGLLVGFKIGGSGGKGLLFSKHAVTLFSLYRFKNYKPMRYWIQSTHFSCAWCGALAAFKYILILIYVQLGKHQAPPLREFCFLFFLVSYFILKWWP